MEIFVNKEVKSLTKFQHQSPDRRVSLDYHRVVKSHPEGPIKPYDSRIEQIVRAVQRRQCARTKSESEPLSRETSGLYLFLVQLCICLHLVAFAIY